MKKLSLFTNENLVFQYSIYIFLLAFLFRVVLVNTLNTNTIDPDSAGYHSLAYNVSEGKGYIGPDGEKYFFREPGFPVFLSFSFQISKLFNNDPEPLSFTKDFKIINKAPEITIAKYVYAILDALACVLFFLIISRILKLRYAFIIGLIFCFYYPYAHHVTHILRETLQSFLALCMCYSLLLYFDKGINKYLIFTGIFWGLLTLTFQASVVFIVTIPIFIWIYKKSITKAIIPSAIVGIVMLLTVSPWLIRTYYYYPDLRILKSFGTTFTPELRAYGSSLYKAEHYGLINREQMYATYAFHWARLPEDEKFKRSWDGTITKQADSINALITEPWLSKRKIQKYGVYFYKAWFPIKVFPMSIKELILKKPILAAILIVPVLIISLFAFVGLFKYYPRFFKINLVISTYIPIFFIISTEYRRMLPALPYIFLYGMLGIIYFYNRFYKRISDKEIEAKIIK